MRDDSILNTGSSSAAFGSTKEAQIQAAKRAEVKEEKDETRAKLKPAVETIKEYVKQELTEIRNLESVDTTLAAEDLKAEMRGREIARQRIISFQTKVLNAMRERS